MSQENVKVVRSALQAFRWGPEGLTPQEIQDLANEFWDPDSDYYPSRKFPESRPCHGREEIMRFFTEYFRAWEHVEMETKSRVPRSVTIASWRTSSCLARGAGAVWN